MTTLAGATALLTGATGSLGQAVADAYCRAGARMILSARDEEPLQALAADLSARYAADVAVLPGDLARGEDIERLADETRRRFGGLDVLVNAAAVIGPIGLTWEVDWDEWQSSVYTNLFAAVRLCQLCVPFMPRGAGRGKIVNLSGGGATSPRPRLSAYATAKTALVRFTETLALEVAGRRIDVNAIAPGILNSGLTRAVVDAGPNRAGQREYDVAVDAIGGATDSRHRAAALALFLGSPASDGISGRLLSAIWDDWETFTTDAPPLDDAAVYTLRRVIPETEGGGTRATTTHTPITVCVAGLWHLGCVTAACLAAAGHQVVGYDEDATVIAALRTATVPVAEPGLSELLVQQAAQGRLRFELEPAVAAGAEVVWVTWDTPIDEEDRPDVEWVLGRVERLFPHLANDAVVLVSSQLPVGSIAELERRFAATRTNTTVSFVCVPENLRLGSALDSFRRTERIVVGTRGTARREQIAALLAPFTMAVEWMGVESAEMTKHAINAFLATSVSFINELAALCEPIGADAAEVSRGLRTDARIGPRAYVSPGQAFAGGTLARELVALDQLASAHGRSLRVIRSVRESNDEHRQWAAATLRRELRSLKGRTVAVWGLAYKPGTNTLRRSDALDLCERLLADGATVRAYDPVVAALPPHLATRMTLAGTAIEAARGADALVVATAWPEFLAVPPERLMSAAGAPLVIDPNGFLAATLGAAPGMRYIRVGRG